MEFLFLLIAFIFGLGFRFVGLPPLIGYLIAGFILNAWGFENNDLLQQIADLGITIMLFTIGLKLNIQDLLKREIWLSSVLHTSIWIAVFSAIVFSLSVFGLPYISDLSLTTIALIGFAFSFSSTVCVVKILEESGESRTRHGKVAIGILVMQDIFAVLFLVFATGKVPSPWAVALFLLIPATPLFRRLLDQSGHGELLPLTGFIFALGGYQLFEYVGVKGDLGALIFGVLIAGHVKANELAKSLLSFKDLLLIGFFLTIGLTALPTLEITGVALLITLLLPLKFLLFFALFTKFRLRARTAFLTGQIMTNYSEFGLIVGAVAVSIGLLDKVWLVILALSVSFSFVFTSAMYKTAHKQYTNYKDRLKRYQSNQALPEDLYPSLANTTVLVIGMGRVGKGAFTTLAKLLDKGVTGMDADIDKVESLKELHYEAILGDGENIDLWESVDFSSIELVLLALPSIDDSSNITHQLRSAGFQGKIAAIARYEDEVNPLLEVGVDKVFNFFTEAGLGFAEESFELINREK
ncbi:cation:proton antiporter [Glaciecola sp. MH2013]|uniref:cation:proton antiporter family protein n=1 Tax=Glaciecola sp. MH2013 TaxID=2785524 RepID=UPI00189CD286|nr:cation:proton antiporter family protein [Glaciecola sp. MH2013]MBF7072821.1 cation:proton antiporter [Glaciecola sp. MH2013]